MAKEEAKRQEEEEKRRQEELALLEQQKLVSEEQWMKEQEARYLELQEEERRKAASQSDAPRSLPADSTSAHSGLNNERATVPSGTLEFVPNDLSDTTQVQPSKQDNTMPYVPDRELKKNLTINDIPRW